MANRTPENKELRSKSWEELKTKTRIKLAKNIRCEDNLADGV